MKNTPRQWRVWELELQAARMAGDPLSVTARAEFRGPAGARISVPAFWDGGRTWRIRFTPTAPGSWRYRIRCDDRSVKGLDGKQGVLHAAAAAAGNPLYQHGGFLRVSPDRRCLTHADGAPFFWLGDTWWFCPSDLMPFNASNRRGIASTYQHLVEIRRQQGYTVLHMAFLGALTPGGKFSGVSGQFSDLYHDRLNRAYWRRVDDYMTHANDSGLVPVVGFGFHQGLNEPTLAQLKKLWRYVLARYGAMAVGWLICGEYNQAGGKDAKGRAVLSPNDQKRIRKILSLGRFIKQNDPYRRAMTVHPWWHRGEKRQAWREPWYDFILLQAGHMKEGPTPGFYQGIPRQGRGKPFIEGECTYEGIFRFSAAVVRRNAYKAMQCGSKGFTYGSHGLWYPNQNEKDRKFSEWGPTVPWWKAIVRPGGGQMRHLRAFYESLPWWTLKPVKAASTIQWKPSGGNPDEVALAAVAADGTCVLYVPPWVGASARPRLFLAGRRAGARYSVTCFNPRTGRATSWGTQAAGTVLRPPRGPLTAEDWVLVVRRVGA